MSVPISKWKWFGHAGHLCVGYMCRFHLTTQVGKYLISTVGDYYPKWDGDRQTIGCGRYFETMVFEAGSPCDLEDCHCGIPEINGNELDFDGYNEAGSAAAGHMRMCRKWSRFHSIQHADDLK